VRGATCLHAGPGEAERAVEGGQSRGIEYEAGSRRARHLEAVPEDPEARDVRGTPDPVLDQDLGGAPVQRAHRVDGRLEVGI